MRIVDECRIACTMQYAIPELIVDPQLNFCQKCIYDVAVAIVNSEKQISGEMFFSIEFLRFDRPIIVKKVTLSFEKGI